MYVVLLGPPGVGKGTQCQRIVSRFHWPVVSTGERLRQAIRAETPLGVQAQSYIDAGRLVPDDVMIDLVGEVLRNEVQGPDCIFDGFPRTVSQAVALDALLDELQRGIDAVIQLRVEPEILRQRMLSRAKVEGRSDDRPATIQTRLETYHRQTAPLVDYYRQRNLLHAIDGAADPASVFQHILEALGMP